MTAPRIYVASLSDYNAGRLHGRWIDADQEPEDIGAEVAEMLAESPAQGAEEWAIHDFDGFGTIRLSEWESFEKVAELGQAVAEHGADLVSAYIDMAGEWSESEFEESYQGEHGSAEEFAQELAEETGAFQVSSRYGGDVVDVSDRWPFTFIDWERVARDLELGGDFHFAEAPGSVYVFRSI